MNMLRRSVGRAVRSRIVPYVALYAVLLALHLQFTLGTGDDPMYAAMLDQYSLAYFSLWHYYTWSARTLIEAVVCIVEALPAIVCSPSTQAQPVNTARPSSLDTAASQRNPSGAAPG